MCSTRAGVSKLGTRWPRCSSLPPSWRACDGEWKMRIEGPGVGVNLGIVPPGELPGRDALSLAMKLAALAVRLGDEDGSLDGRNESNGARSLDASWPPGNQANEPTS